MTVIRFPHPPPPRHDADHPGVCRSVPIRGTFAAPRGRPGTMTGTLRLEQVRVSADSSVVDAVFTGELFDAEGQRIGTCSRRQSAPARLGDSEDEPLTVGPVDVDLMGLVVTVPATTVPWSPETAPDLRSCPPASIARVEETS